MPTKDGVCIYPQMAIYFLVNTVTLWSSHFFQNGQDLGGEETAYSSGGKRFFKRGGEPMPPPFSEKAKEKPLNLRQAIELALYGTMGQGRSSGLDDEDFGLLLNSNDNVKMARWQR